MVSCSTPNTMVKQGVNRPSLAIHNAPMNTTLYVDGLLAGEVKQFNGKPNVLLVEPGKHFIEIKSPNGTVLHKRTVFVESALKTIDF